MLSKKELRKEMRARRDALSPAYRAEASAAICRHFLADPAFMAGHTFALYAAAGSEADLSDLAEAIRSRGGVTLYPLCTAEAGRMEFYAVEDMTGLRPGKWGIPEPDPSRCRRADAEEIDRMVLPCLAMDSRGNRLGYGGGYYDRYLAREGFRAETAAAAFAAQMTEQVPAEPTDRRVGRWMTEYGPNQAVR